MHHHQMETVAEGLLPTGTPSARSRGLLPRDCCLRARPQHAPGEIAASRWWIRPRVSRAPRAMAAARLLASATRVAARPGRLLAHDCWLRPRVSHASRTIVGSRLLASATREPRVQGVEPKGMRRRVLVSPTVRSRRSPRKFKLQDLISQCMLLEMAVCPSHKTR